jgi:PPK2 family polyphosphate:nucleotide phosphotransferase
MKLSKRFIVVPGSKVKLSGRDPDDTAGYRRKQDAKAALAGNVKRLAELQYLLYAENRRALLVVLQAMDAGGKDGTIRHVMGPMNPQSCKVTSFKAPTEEELAHDFLWRIHRAVPRKGEIGIFNRSHYEDVLIVRVHAEAAKPGASQPRPAAVPKAVWSKRYEQINAFEKALTAAGVHILKFFLHISKDEQLKRLKRRLEDPRRHWKADPRDFAERKLWEAYMAAYEDALSKCSTKRAPWYVIPANKKWFRNLAVSEIIAETLESLHMKFPKPAFDVSKIVAE